MLNDEGFLQCESASSVNDLQVGGMGTDTALQNVVDESNSSPNVSVTATASDNTSNTNTSSTTDTIRAKVKVSRKRMSNIPLRKQSMRKKLRNSGQEYVRSGGSLAESRSLGPDCSCRKQCMSALTRSHCQSLFSNFWAINDFNQQNAFLFGQIQSIKPARRYVDARDSRRQFTFLFYVKDDCGESVRVCKQAFLSIFGLQNCRGRINNIMTQMVSGSGTPKTDNRGKHDNRPNRTESSIMDDVRNHINSFPKYESHYSRKDNIGRKYLGSELSINTMYDLYVAKCTETDRPTASRDCYRRTFCCDFNLGFAAPKTDTCKHVALLKYKSKHVPTVMTEKNWTMSGHCTSSKHKKLLKCFAMTQ